jgi:integrase
MACKKAGVKGKIFHDLRRSSVRNMIRPGVPQSVAMPISGHRTISMFLRYGITSEDDKRKALRDWTFIRLDRANPPRRGLIRREKADKNTDKIKRG